jgi:O-glycosyl hydrolase
VKYIQEMKKNGITIDAALPQNEPYTQGITYVYDC